MKRVSKVNGLIQCDACKLKYADKETAEKCEEWCTKNNSCNLEIIKQSNKE